MTDRLLSISLEMERILVRVERLGEEGGGRREGEERRVEER
jgi:hypothetical protein